MSILIRLSSLSSPLMICLGKGSAECWLTIDISTCTLFFFSFFFFPAYARQNQLSQKGKVLKVHGRHSPYVQLQLLGYISPPPSPTQPGEERKKKKKRKRKSSQSEKDKKKIRKVPRAHDSKVVPNFWPPAPLGVGGKLLVAQPPRISLFLLSTHPRQARLPSFSSVLIPPGRSPSFSSLLIFPPCFPSFSHVLMPNPKPRPCFPPFLLCTHAERAVVDFLHALAQFHQTSKALFSWSVRGESKILTYPPPQTKKTHARL